MSCLVVLVLLSVQEQDTKLRHAYPGYKVQR